LHWYHPNSTAIGLVRVAICRANLMFQILDQARRKNGLRFGNSLPPRI
jgi:hypothetical protein